MATIDANIPLGVKPPDMMGQISGLLGIQQQQQALQQQQAQAQQAQMDLAERNAAVGLLKDPDAAGFMGADGVIDPAKAIPAILKAAPRTGGAFIEPIMAGFRAQLDVQQAAQDLNRSIREDVNAGLSAAAANPAATFGDLLVAADLIKEQNPKAAGAVNSMLKYLKPDDPMEATRKRLTMFARTVLGAPEMAGPSGLLTPAAGTISTGESVVPTATDRTTGAMSQASPAIPMGIPPGFEMFTDQRTGNTYLINRQSGEMRDVGAGFPGSRQGPMAAPGAAPTGGGRPASLPAPMAPGQAEITKDQAKEVSARVAGILKEAGNTPQAMDSLKRARDIIESGRLNTGTAFERMTSLKNLAASLGVEAGEDANSLVKNLARYQASRANTVGLGSTDAARELAEKGSPNTKIDPKALTGVITQSLAVEMALAGYAKIQSGATDPATMLKNERAFQGIPNLIAAYEYGLARTPQEAQDFLKKHNLSAEDMRDARKKLRDMGAL